MLTAEDLDFVLSSSEADIFILGRYKHDISIIFVKSLTKWTILRSMHSVHLHTVPDCFMTFAITDLFTCNIFTTAVIWPQIQLALPFLEFM